MNEQLIPTIAIENGRLLLNRQLVAIPSSIRFDAPLLPAGKNGLVFKAFDKTLARTIAVKLWLPCHNEDRTVKRFKAQAEARKMAGLFHPNIASIHSAAMTDDGYFFSTMEYLEGETLADWLEKGDRSIPERYRIWYDFADGLKHAHSLGIYHGDIHSRNVFINNGRAKLIDFGTSLLWPNAVRSKDMESAQLLALTEEMFPSPRLRDIASLDVFSIDPEHMLHACHAWVELRWVFNDIAKRMNDMDDYWWNSQRFRIAITVGESPLLATDKLFAWFRSLDTPALWISGLLDVINAEMDALLKGLNSHGVNFFPERAESEKLAETLILARAASQKYLGNSLAPWSAKLD